MTDQDASLCIGIWQDGGALGDVNANLNAIELAAAQAADRGVQLLIFPECFLTGYFNRDDPRQIAGNVDENTISTVAKIAGIHGLALLVGIYETNKRKIFNSAVFVDAHGCVRTCYRKRMLFGEWEQRVFTRGDTRQMVNCGGIQVAILICFDVEFPELARDCAQAGADLIAVPTALMAPSDNIAQQLIPARAMENQLYIAYANRIGHEHDLRYVGQSTICDPHGNMLTRGSSANTELLVATIRKSVIAHARRRFSYLSEVDRMEF